MFRPLILTRIALPAAAVAILIGALVAPATPGVAADETCPQYDLAKTFAEEFYPDLKWDTRGGKRTLTWTWAGSNINGTPVTRAFNETEQRSIRRSFEAWDMALDWLTLQQVDSLPADIQIGLTPIQNSGYWTVERDGEYRANGTIQISSTPAKPFTEDVFVTVVVSELGNLLGLGDIQGANPPFHSAMLDPDVEPFGVIPLVDQDINMMRQLYGESTCQSSWSAELKKAKEDAAKATATPTPTPTPTVTPTPTPTVKPVLKKTIICIKGKTVKLVKAVKPVCPKGYKKR